MISILGRKEFFGITIAVLIVSLTVVSAQEVSAVGLKVFVSLSHSKSGSANVCVNSIGQNLGCRTITLSGLATPYTVGPFTFGDNVIPVGGQFKACATNLANQQIRCVSGTNGPQKEPEYVALAVPSSGGINWLGVCRNPIVDILIAEPCTTLTTPDGYILTAEGNRVLRCIAGGTVLMILDPSGQTLAAAQALGPAVGCG